LVKKHALLFPEKMHLENLVQLNMTEGKVINRDYSALPDGSMFIDPHHPYTNDLDVFGAGSIFQYMNRCNTIIGQKQFAEGLSNPLSDREVIYERQEAVKELSGKIQFRQDFQAAGMESGEQPQDHEQLIAWLKQPSILHAKKTLGIILIVLPVLTVGAVVGAFFIPYIKLVATILIIIQWIILATQLKKINAFHDYISRKKNILKRYAR